MKILHVFYGNDFVGGASYSMASLVSGLAQKGHEVHAVVPPTKQKAMKRFLERNGVVAHEMPVPWLAYSQSDKRILYRMRQELKSLAYRAFLCDFVEWRIRSIIRRYGIEVVHIGGAVINAGVKAARKENCRVVWHVREFVQEDHGLDFFSWVDPYSQMNDADQIICVSRSVAEKMKRICSGVPIHVVYNGIDPTIYSFSPRQGFGQPIRIMSSSGISETKGTFVTLEAIAEVSKKIPIVYDIYGGSDRPSLQRFNSYCDRAGLRDIVRYHGKTESIEKEYAEHDIQLVASRCEAYGRVTAEAMMCGCMVVGSNSGGTAELLADGRGYLFKPGDSGSLASALFDAARDDSLQAMTFAAHCFADKYCSIESYVSSVERVYEQCKCL